MASPSSFLIVAIDGGAASGKSSTARALAARFPFLHVDTGAHYRAITAEMLRRGVPPEETAVTRALGDLLLGTRVQNGAALLEIGGRVPGDEIRSPEVNAAVSHFAALRPVRAGSPGVQRGQAGVAQAHGFRGLIMEGRDIGSVIFPEAGLRVFLHADPEERARRRAKEGQQDSVAERDRLDSSRQHAPLTCPTGAVDINSTHLSLDDVVAQIAALVNARTTTAP